MKNNLLGCGVEHGDMNVYKVYRNIHILSALTIGILEIVRHKSLGEATKLNLLLDTWDLGLLLCLQVFTLMLMIPVFILSTRNRMKFFLHKNNRLAFMRRKYHLYFEEKHAHIAFLFILIANILFTLYSKNGVVLANVHSDISFIFNIIKISPLMSIYYVCMRDCKSTLFWINVTLYFVFQLLCGWTGVILQYFFFELFLSVRKKGTLPFFGTVCKWPFLSVPVLAALGGWAYRWLYPLKLHIRQGAAMEALGFEEGIKALVLRFTNFPITVAAVQEHNAIAWFYQHEGNPFAEVLNIFRPLVPRMIMPSKEFGTLGSIVKMPIYGALDARTSTGYCPFVYWFNLAESDLGCFMVGLLLMIVLTIMTKKIIYWFDDGTKRVDILWFIFVAQILVGAPIGALFGYGYTSLVYTIPLLMVFGVIRVNKPKKRIGGICRL